MSLATPQKWIDDNPALLHIADVDGDGATDLDSVQKALTKAFDEMNGWLASRYPKYPNAAVATLQMHEVRIATHHLASTAQATTDDIKDGYKASIDFLKSVAAGRADLPGTDQGGEDIDSGSGGVQMEAPECVFSRKALGDF